MITGILLRLALCALFFAVARYALKPDLFSTMLGDLAERFFKPRDAFDKANTYQPRLVQVFYGFSALFFIFTWTFLYHHLRQLKVVADPATNTRPYAGSPSTMPGGANPYSGLAPGRQPAQPGAQPYGGQPGTTQPYGGQPGTAQPYGGQPQGQPGATPQPYGGQPAGGQPAQPYGGRPAGTQQVQPGAQPYGR